jgi:hypothetical protein
MKNTLKLAIFILFALGFKISKAQTNYILSLGLSTHSVSNSVYSGMAYSATASPRYTIVEISDDLNLSVGTHASLGFTLPSSGPKLFIDFPVVGEINFGHASSNEPSYDFGGFIGAGIGNNVMTYDYNGKQSERSSRGLYLNGGVKFYMGGRSFGLRLSYMNDSKSNTNIYGVGLMYNLGEF